MILVGLVQDRRGHGYFDHRHGSIPRPGDWRRWPPGDNAHLVVEVTTHQDAGHSASLACNAVVRDALELRSMPAPPRHCEMCVSWVRDRQMVWAPA